MFQTYRKLIIALGIILGIPLFVLMCCDVSITHVGDVMLETAETETESVDPMDVTALELFDTEKGLTIKMSSEMEENKSGDHTVYYFSDACMVSVKMIGFEELVEAGTGSKRTTLEEYVKMVEDGNENITFTTDSYGNVSTTYTAEGDDDESFAYYATVRKGSNAFWMINFACMEDTKDFYIPQFELWGSTIEVQ